jgi:hypothetical protein
LSSIQLAMASLAGTSAFPSAMGFDTSMTKAVAFCRLTGPTELGSICSPFSVSVSCWVSLSSPV